MPKTTENTDIAVKDNNLALDLSSFAEFQSKDGVIEGLENVESTDIRMPRHKLLQSTSEEVSKGLGKPGEFYNTLTHESSPSLEVALLCMSRSRVRFATPYKRGAAALCRSLNGKVSEDGEICKGCLYADWDKAKEDGKTAPECRESITWTFFEDGKFNELPSRIIVAGASRAEHSRFITRLAGLGYPPYIFRTTITSEQQSNDSGIFYVAKFDLKLDDAGRPATYTVEEARKLQGECHKWKAMQDRFAEYDTQNSTIDMIEDEEAGGIYS